MKKRMVLAMTFVLCAASVAIAGEKLNIEVVSKGFQHDFWVQVNRGCTAAGEEFGANVNFVGPASESNIAEQIEQLSNAVNKKPDAICFAALSPESSMDMIFQARDAGIPVITFDSDIGGDTGGAVKAFVATDNKDAGAAAATEMYNRLKDKLTGSDYVVHIGVLSQDTTSQSVGDRTIGFIEKMVELCGADTTSVEGHVKYNKHVVGAKVVLDVGIPAETTDSQMNTVTQTVFNKSNLVGVYASNEFAAKSMVNVDETFQLLGPDKVIGIGFDSGIVQVEAVRERILYGAITQNPYMIGYLSVKSAVEAAKGQPVKDIAVPFFFYTADNMNNPEIASCLYE
ncbi:MAG: substrate-binding domain-containing protein [Planctomycetaceae bacterium]|nr:substrate-binding domain-containing protein [Planctomycetaceae bacterium]